MPNAPVNSRLDLADMGVDCRIAVSACDRDAVMAVLNEVQIPDAVDVGRSVYRCRPGCAVASSPPLPARRSRLRSSGC